MVQTKFGCPGPQTPLKGCEGHLGIIQCTHMAEMHHSIWSDVETRDKWGGLRTAVAPALLLVFQCIQHGVFSVERSSVLAFEILVLSDEDECAREEDPCKENEFCTNTVGSYKCNKCHESCGKCTGPTANDCLACSSTYYDHDGDCKGNSAVLFTL